MSPVTCKAQSEQGAQQLTEKQEVLLLRILSELDSDEEGFAFLCRRGDRITAASLVARGLLERREPWYFGFDRQDQKDMCFRVTAAGVERLNLDA